MKVAQSVDINIFKGSKEDIIDLKGKKGRTIKKFSMKNVCVLYFSESQCNSRNCF